MNFDCKFMDSNDEFLSVLVYENDGNKYEVWINMLESPETMYYLEGSKPNDKNFENILLEYLKENYPDYFPPVFF